MSHVTCAFASTLIPDPFGVKFMFQFVSVLDIVFPSRRKLSTFNCVAHDNTSVSLIDTPLVCTHFDPPSPRTIALSVRLAAAVTSHNPEGRLYHHFVPPPSVP